MRSPPKNTCKRRDGIIATRLFCRSMATQGAPARSAGQRSAGPSSASAAVYTAPAARNSREPWRRFRYLSRAGSRPVQRSGCTKSAIVPAIFDGHSDIGVTLTPYTHLGYDDAKEEWKRLPNGEWRVVKWGNSP